MQVPTIAGTIRRRILVNYRVEPSVLASNLPDGFRPKLYHGWGIAGICLIRLEQIRPEFLHLPIGHSSENAAHRIAVTWTDDDGTEHDGVFIPRRDSNSFLNRLAGGRLFPGQHHAARFDVTDRDGQIDFSMRSDDGVVTISLSVRESTEFPRDSTFATLSEASAFFESGQDGYSACAGSPRLDGMRLHVKDWCVTPLVVDRVETSFFDDPNRFPAGSAQFDCALLMRNVAHEWRAIPARHSDCESAPYVPSRSGLAGSV